MCQGCSAPWLGQLVQLQLKQKEKCSLSLLLGFLMACQPPTQLFSMTKALPIGVQAQRETSFLSKPRSSLTSTLLLGGVID